MARHRVTNEQHLIECMSRHRVTNEQHLIECMARHRVTNEQHLIECMARHRATNEQHTSYNITHYSAHHVFTRITYLRPCDGGGNGVGVVQLCAAKRIEKVCE